MLLTLAIVADVRSGAWPKVIRYIDLSPEKWAHQQTSKP